MLIKPATCQSQVICYPLLSLLTVWVSFPGGTSGKEPSCNAEDFRDMGLIPGLVRPSGGGHGSRLQNYCLENPFDKRVW